MPLRVTPIIAHERIAAWTGRLRPRFSGDPRCRWVESRSTADLVAAVHPDGSDSATDPAVLIDLDPGPHWGLDALLGFRAISPNALILVLDPARTPDVPLLARELGADLVWSGVVVPPQVSALLSRWVDLLQDRAARHHRRPATASLPC